MDNINNNTEAFEEQQNQFSVKDYITSCLSHWQWFVISVIILCCLGYLQVLRKAPVYARTMSVLIKDTSSNGGIDIPSSFSSFGFGGGNTNVNNELISLTSPAVISEVVKRLDLNINMTMKGTFHGTALYGSNNPISFYYPDLNEKTSLSFKMDLNPDDTFVLYKFVHLVNGDKLKYSQEVKGKIGFDPVKTPVGTFYFRPNGNYVNDREETETIFISVGSYASATERYLGKVSGDLADADAEVINLSIDDTSVTRATDILNTIVEVYNEYWVEDKNKVNVATSKFITDRLAMLSGELGDVDNEIAKFQSENKMPDIQATSQMYIQRAGVVSNDILSVTNQLAMAEFVRDYINNPANRNNVIPSNTGLGLGTQSLDASIKEYNTLLLNRNNLESNSGSVNPIVKDYDKQLAGMRDAILRSLNSQIGTLQANLRNLDKAQGVNDNELSQTPNQAKFLGSIKREQSVKEALYLYLLQKLEETELSQSYNASNTRIITPPYGSMKPIAPKKTMTLAMCFILGLVIPAALIYVMVISDDRVKSRRDLENLPIPFAGEIPHVGKKDTLKKYLKTKKQRQREIDKPKPIVAEGKRDVPNEAFRVVRSNIDLMIGRNTDEKVIMVTSFNPGSGKSFVAFNLGASFALKRKRVLLIDGDLRHGSLSTYVDSPRKGLSNYLTGSTDDVDSLIRQVENFKDLYVLPIGHRPPNPAELLETERMGELLDKVKTEFDIILVDCPPVNVVVDTQLLNRYADRTIFVVRANLLKKSAVNDLAIIYQEKKLRRMSILLNGTESGHSSYYTYGNYQSLEE